MELVKPDRKNQVQIKKLQKRIGVLERRIKRKRRMLNSRMVDVYDLKNHIHLLSYDLHLERHNLDNMMGLPVQEGFPHLESVLTNRIMELLLELPPPFSSRVLELLLELPPPCQPPTKPTLLKVVHPSPQKGGSTKRESHPSN